MTAAGTLLLIIKLGLLQLPMTARKARFRGFAPHIVHFCCIGGHVRARVQLARDPGRHLAALPRSVR